MSLAGNASAPIKSFARAQAHYFGDEPSFAVYYNECDSFAQRLIDTGDAEALQNFCFRAADIATQFMRGKIDFCAPTNLLAVGEAQEYRAAHLYVARLFNYNVSAGRALAPDATGFFDSELADDEPYVVDANVGDDDDSALF